MYTIRFLGTGSALHTKRRMTSICFQAKNKTFLIDCGDGFSCIRQLLKVNISPTVIQDIFVTHAHADHIVGLPHLLFYQLIKRKNSIIRIYGPKETLSTVKKICFLTHEDIKNRANRLRFIPLTTRKSVRIGVNTITSARMKGRAGAPVCYAYSIQKGSKKVVFSSDTKPNKALNKLSENTTMLIHECFGTSSHQQLIRSYGHSTAKDAALLAARSQTKHLVLTHLHEQKGVEKAIRLEARKYFSGTITVAEDEMVLAV